MENEHISVNERLIDFISASPSPFHAVKTVSERLEKDGFTYLSEGGKWNIVKGGRYYTVRNGSSLIAFTVPENPAAFMISAAHTDSPCFKLKPNADKKDAVYARANTEKYGGMLCATWFDRPLSAAGRVVVSDNGRLRSRLVDFERPLFIIPSVAVHMNRNANENASFNAASDMQPVLGLGEKNFSDLLAEKCGCGKDDVLSFDMYLYQNGGTLVGAGDEFVCSPRLDDLQCVFSLLEGFAPSRSDNVNVFCAFDNEEVGSSTKQGAASGFLYDVLYRICESLGYGYSDFCAMLDRSFMISADNAHAIHPSHPELSDRDNVPQMNKGITVKFNANQKYTTDAVSCAIFKKVCERCGAPVQMFANRSDMAGGSTLGSISNTRVAVRTVDIGLPQLAMHSSFETAGSADTAYLIKASAEFYANGIPDIEYER